MRCEKREIRDPRFRSVISYPDRTRTLEMFHLLDRARSGYDYSIPRRETCVILAHNA